MNQEKKTTQVGKIIDQGYSWGKKLASSKKSKMDRFLSNQPSIEEKMNLNLNTNQKSIN